MTVRRHDHTPTHTWKTSLIIHGAQVFIIESSQKHIPNQLRHRTSPAAMRHVDMTMLDIELTGKIAERQLVIAFLVSQFHCGGNHRRARRMRRHPVEGAHATRAHRLADILDLDGFAVERPAYHQKRAFGAKPVQLLDDGFRGVPPEHDFVHRAKYDTALVHACPPGTSC